MDPILMDIIGYCGSAVVTASLMMSNIKKFRWINLIGTSIFTVYAVLLQAWPIVGVNIFIIIVNAYFLVKIRYHPDYFNINEYLTGNEYFVKKFIEFWSKEIQASFPGFDMKKIDDPKVIVVMRNMNPVALFVYEWEKEHHVIHIHVDFAIPAYRDMKNSRVLMNRKIGAFRKDGALQFITQTSVDKHKKYLRKMGFVADLDGITYRRAV